MILVFWEGEILNWIVSQRTLKGGSIDSILPTRREVIDTIWKAVVIGLPSFVLYHSLRELITKSKKSIDDYANPTDIMINRLSKVTKDDVIPLGADYIGNFLWVDAIIKDPSIIEDYFINYLVYFSEEGNKITPNYETMNIKL